MTFAIKDSGVCKPSNGSTLKPIRENVAVEGAEVVAHRKMAYGLATWSVVGPVLSRSVSLTSISKL